MQIPLYQIDAFTRKLFRGNPAAVCPLPQWLDDALLQKIASENNLSETAFCVGKNGDYELRWFTPDCEVDLCGHATLATAWTLREECGDTAEEFVFRTKSGRLRVKALADLLVMNFPASPAQPRQAPKELIEAMGSAPEEVFAAQDWLLCYPSQEAIAALEPDFHRLKGIELRGVIATAAANAGEGIDFVSRWFGPNVGVDEDPVTGSAHCILAPFWADRLKKTDLSAMQISKRGGELGLRYLREEGRVEISGSAVLYARASIFV